MSPFSGLVDFMNFRAIKNFFDATSQTNCGVKRFERMT